VSFTIRPLYPPESLDEELGVLQNGSGQGIEWESLLPVPGIESRFTGCRACSVDYIYHVSCPDCNDFNKNNS
jgi:hypothetical protein